MGSRGAPVPASWAFGLPVEVRERGEPAGGPADDREHQGHPVAGGAHHGLRAAAHRDPRGKTVLGLRTCCSTSGGRRSPDQVTGPSGSKRGEQVELLAEQLLVLLEVEAEQGERLGERPAARGRPPAQPFDIASIVEKRWNTRIGSSLESTVTADPG